MTAVEFLEEYDLDELAGEWVFEINGHKWSNNDDTAGDNYGSFKAGFQEAIEILKRSEMTHNGSQINAVTI